jgi:UDP:flavonoid glycosyltransferase YjiC (YdhE family)
VARIVLTSFGSYGDVYPYLAIGRRLVQRGHQAVIAAPAMYRRAAEDAGLEFAAIRPDVDFDDPELFAKAMDTKHGTEFVARELVMPHLDESLEDLRAATEGADLITSHVLTYAAPMLGELSGRPWVSTVLSPMVFCSAHDPPALPPIPWFAKTRALGPGVVGLIWRLMRKLSWSWSAPVRERRRALGLNADADPFWEGQHSPHGVLALFSEVLAAPQPDWPDATTVCGFPFHDEDFGGGDDAQALDAFLAAGDAPLVFSLGSSAVQAAGDFHDQAARAGRELGRRAVLVTGGAEAPADAGDDVLAIRSASVASLFPKAALVVHAGGVGSTGQALRAGRPQLVVPFAHDQFDNAVRVERLGVGAVLKRSRLTVPRLTQLLRRTLSDEAMVVTATTLATRVAAEDGASVACDALEALLPST